MYCVAISCNPGYNCGGSFDNRSDAEKYQSELWAEGYSCRIVFRQPWGGTIGAL